MLASGSGGLDSQLNLVVLESHKFLHFLWCPPLPQAPRGAHCGFEAPLDTELLGGLQEAAADCVAAMRTSARRVQGQGFEF